MEYLFANKTPQEFTVANTYIPLTFTLKHSTGNISSTGTQFTLPSGGKYEIISSLESSQFSTTNICIICWIFNVNTCAYVGRRLTLTPSESRGNIAGILDGGTTFQLVCNLSTGVTEMSDVYGWLRILKVSD